MIQLDLFDPATWCAALPLGPRVKRPWKKPSYVTEVREPTVADLLSGHWKPLPWPKGYACIYKATRIETGQGYVGKAVDLRKRFQGHMYKDEYFGLALRKHGPENFSIEVLRVFETEDDAYAQEDSFIEEHRTRSAVGGYNIGDGGLGFTSEDARKFGALGGAVTGMQAQPRVLAELEKGSRSIDSLMTSLGLARTQVYTAFNNLRHKGHHILGEPGGLYRLGTLEQAGDDWASGRALTDQDRALGALMEGQRTATELLPNLGAPRGLASGIIYYLRRNGYNIENRGANGGTGAGGTPGTYHLIIDHKRHPWLHLGVIDLCGAALDDRE